MDLHLRGLSDREHGRLEAISWAIGSNKNAVALAAIRSALRNEQALTASARTGHHQEQVIKIPSWLKEATIERRKAAKRHAARLVANVKTQAQKIDELYDRVHPEADR